MKTATEAIQYVRLKVMLARNIATIVGDGARFTEAWAKASDPDKAQIVKCIESGDSKELARILRTLLREELATLSARELRDIAQKYGIRYYSYLSKAGLLSALAGVYNESDSQPPK